MRSYSKAAFPDVQLVTDQFALERTMDAYHAVADRTTGTAMIVMAQ